MCIVVQEACALKKKCRCMSMSKHLQQCNERVQKGEICELIKEKVVRKRGDVHGWNMEYKELDDNRPGVDVNRNDNNARKGNACKKPKDRPERPEDDKISSSPVTLFSYWNSVPIAPQLPEPTRAVLVLKRATMRISSEQQQTPSWSSYPFVADPATLYLSERIFLQ